jgi:phage baseplate assembly protein W
MESARTMEPLVRPPITWPLLPVPDANGQLTYPTLEASVRQLIQVVLRTRPGEQLMRPEFGAGLESYLHEPNTIVTRRRLRDLIVASLDKWEPRILVDRIDVREVDDEPSQIRIELGYRIRRTGQMQQMGVTLKLE